MLSDPSPTAPRRTRRKAALLAALLLLLTAFIALGSWQVQRRTWKLALIERVESRVNAPAVQAPGPARWPQVDAANDEYRHVRATGVYLTGADTLVQAVTARGAGFWLMTPLKQADGSITLVNRGLVPPEWREAARQSVPPPAGETAVTGLLRLTEPGGGFLRRNDAAGNRWFSRDVQAIAQARGLANVAPYFIDAAAAPGAADTPPIGGLTVVAFRNHHLVYALTWYTLALMVAGAAWRLIREERRPSTNDTHE